MNEARELGFLFLNHLCDEELALQDVCEWREFLNHLCDEELELS